jgi:hypothetical protein
LRSAYVYAVTGAVGTAPVYFTGKLNRAFSF